MRAIAGLAVWVVVLIAIPERGTMGEIDRLLLLGVLVTTPSAFELATAGRDSSFVRAMRTALLPAGALAAASFALERGASAALLASPWLLACVAIAVFSAGAAFPRAVARRAAGTDRAATAPASEDTPATALCLLAGALYLPIGAAWLVVSRLGWNPRGFSEAIVLLTSVHFHFAGFATPVLAGLAAGRMAVRSGAARRRATNAICAAVVAGTPLLAAGITFSKTLERAAALLLAVSVAALGAFHLAAGRALVRSGHARASLALSGVAGLASMALAVSFALREPLGIRLDIATMARTHGWLNGVGFVGLGLTGWMLEERLTCSSR
jgi:YndJ-like protein